MGIYTSNRYLMNEAYDYASEIPANEAYDAAFGCAHILADCQANDMALFESAIYSDFEEVKSLQEGYGYVNENAFSNTIKKIVEMFKKIIAKIKGIFAAFIAKLTGAFADGKKLVKKYEKQIIKYSNWKGFKCKGIRKPKGGGTSIKDKIEAIFGASGSKGVGNSSKARGKYILKIAQGGAVTIDEIVDSFETDPGKIKEMENSDIKKALIGSYIKGFSGDYEDLNKEVFDMLYEDVDTIDGDDDNVSSSTFTATWVKGVLIDDKWVSDVKKANDTLEKNINMIIDNLNRTDDNIAEFIKKNDKAKVDSANAFDVSHSDHGNGNKVQKVDHKFTANVSDGADSAKIQEAVHALQKVASQEQEVISKYTAEYMTQVKFAIAQARKIWTAGAAWSSGVHKESVEYVNAVAECAAEQFYTNMEAIH